MLKQRKIPVIIGDIGGTNSRLSIVKMSKVILNLNCLGIRRRNRSSQNTNFAFKSF